MVNKQDSLSMREAMRQYLLPMSTMGHGIIDEVTCLQSKLNHAQEIYQTINNTYL